MLKIYIIKFLLFLSSPHPLPTFKLICIFGMCQHAWITRELFFMTALFFVAPLKGEVTSMLSPIKRQQLMWIFVNGDSSRSGVKFHLFIAVNYCIYHKQTVCNFTPVVHWTQIDSKLTLSHCFTTFLISAGAVAQRKKSTLFIIFHKK